MQRAGKAHIMFAMCRSRTIKTSWNPFRRLQNPNQHAIAKTSSSTQPTSSLQPGCTTGSCELIFSWLELCEWWETSVSNNFGDIHDCYLSLQASSAIKDCNKLYHGETTAINLQPGGQTDKSLDQDLMLNSALLSSGSWKYFVVGSICGVVSQKDLCASCTSFEWKLNIPLSHTPGVRAIKALAALFV